ncbi:hypothetical protein ACVXZY_11890 [Staphylococcus aureus]
MYTDVEDVKIAISDRFKLLQSQYTDEKYKEALEIIATKFGLTVNDAIIKNYDVCKSTIKTLENPQKRTIT